MSTELCTVGVLAGATLLVGFTLRVSLLVTPLFVVAPLVTGWAALVTFVVRFELNCLGDTPWYAFIAACVHQIGWTLMTILKVLDHKWPRPIDESYRAVAGAAERLSVVGWGETLVPRVQSEFAPAPHAIPPNPPANWPPSFFGWRGALGGQKDPDHKWKRALDAVAQHEAEGEADADVDAGERRRLFTLQIHATRVDVLLVSTQAIAFIWMMASTYLLIAWESFAFLRIDVAALTIVACILVVRSAINLFSDEVVFSRHALGKRGTRNNAKHTHALSFLIVPYVVVVWTCASASQIASTLATIPATVYLFLVNLLPLMGVVGLAALRLRALKPRKKDNDAEKTLRRDVEIQLAFGLWFGWRFAMEWGWWMTYVGVMAWSNGELVPPPADAVPYVFCTALSCVSLIFALATLRDSLIHGTVLAAFVFRGNLV